ncbi:hypothetical protein B0H10DRAFT_1960158 [Mycena sp. CBHHK59/15]|nr:hypothetical protein B0H10DRAFT_1960158 [Mycena sp. CBHHK59/15]
MAANWKPTQSRNDLRDHLVEAASDAEHSDDVLAWESDEESDAGEDDSEQWEQQPLPITYEERLSKLAVRREQAAEKRRVAEMQSAEMRLGGQMDSQKGKKRGSYNVGGPSKRSIQEKSKKLRDDFNNGVLNISATELDRRPASPDSVLDIMVPVNVIGWVADFELPEVFDIFPRTENGRLYLRLDDFEAKFKRKGFGSSNRHHPRTHNEADSKTFWLQRLNLSGSDLSKVSAPLPHQPKYPKHPAGLELEAILASAP